MGDKTGFLVIHGFGGNINEIRPLRAYLQNKGYIVLSPELAGHTGRRYDLYTVNYHDWIKSAERDLITLKQQCDKIVIIGFSMGGLIAFNLALKYPVHALATLNMPIYYWDINRILRNLYDDIKAKKNDYMKQYLKSAFQYPFTALFNFKRLLIKTKKILNRFDYPIFIAQGMLDDTVQHKSAEFIYNSVSSNIKEIKYYDHSNHLICHSPDKDILFNDVSSFMERINTKAQADNKELKTLFINESL